MSFGIRLHVWGDFALFSRPEMKVERVSYDVITPSAARGILEALYWKPEINWVIDRLHVLKPIRTMQIRRNEVGCKASASNAASAMKKGSGDLGIYIEDERQQRAATVLKDVAYIIEAHFVIVSGEENTAKHVEMFKRRAKAGQYFHHPYFGCREFDAHFELIEDGQPLPAADPKADKDRDFGYMLHDIDFAHDKMPRFFDCKMRGGIIKVPPFDSAEVRG